MLLYTRNIRPAPVPIRAETRVFWAFHGTSVRCLAQCTADDWKHNAEQHDMLMPLAGFQTDVSATENSASYT